MTKNPKMDDVTGRIKEAAGDLTDNDELRREGKADRAGAKVKQTADDLADKASDAVDAVKRKLGNDD